MSERYTAPMPVCVECCRGVDDTRLHDAWRASTTPAPEPAAAPAVDDDLSRDILAAALHVQGRLDSSRSQDARDFLASEPMQRLRAAWAAEAVRSGDVVERAQYDHVLTEAKVVERERDEAYRQKTEWQATAGRLAAERDTLKVKVEVLQIEGDEARAESEQWRQDCNDARAYVNGLTAEVERLRAAQQPLPDVGPVTREDRDYVRVDGVVLWADRDNLEGVVKLNATGLARARAALTFVDAEAADTSSDDEDVLPDPEDLAEVVAALDEEFGSPSRNVTWADVVREIDAHRARGGQEAGL